MGIFEKLKGTIPDDIYEDSDDLLGIYINYKFDYLGMPRSAWENLFAKKITAVIALNLVNSEFSGELCRRVNLVVKKYIRSELKNRDIRICDNLLMKLQRTYRGGLILRNFIYEFEQLGISFMDEVYDLVKEESTLFKVLLERIGISNLSKEQFAHYVHKEYKIDTNHAANQKQKTEKKVNTSAPVTKKKKIQKNSSIGDTIVKSDSPDISADDKKEEISNSTIISQKTESDPLDITDVDKKKSESSGEKSVSILENIPVVDKKMENDLSLAPVSDKGNGNNPENVSVSDEIMDIDLLTSFIPYIRPKSTLPNIPVSNDSEENDSLDGIVDDKEDYFIIAKQIETVPKNILRGKKMEFGSFNSSINGEKAASILSNSSSSDISNSIVRTNDSKKLESTPINTSVIEEMALLTHLVIDDELMEKYSKLTFEEIKKLYGDRFNSLPSDSVQLLERFFSVPQSNFYLSNYDMEKTINLLLYGYKRKSTEIDLAILVNVYLQNKDKFNEEESLYLECVIFNLQDKEIFEQRFPEFSSIKRADLINKLEMLYYGTEDIFDSSLTKDQYLSVLEKNANEIDESMKEILDDYYGTQGPALSLQEISKKYGMSYEDTKYLIKRLKRLCLSLYSNLNISQKVDSEIYMPYVLDERYNLRKETREALLLYFEGVSYDEIEKRIGKKGVADIISKGIQKIDAYRFGVEKIKQEVEDETVEVETEDIIAEIERHASESIITNDEKAFLSYLFGIKNKYNPEGEKLDGKKLQDRLGFKRGVPARYKDIHNKLRQRKLGNLEPEFIVMPRDQLSQILLDPHLPITKEDRVIICSLLELNGYSFKTLAELAGELNITSKVARRKFQIAIININKYLIGEKEGIIDYETDIVPNLKYFTSKERELIHDYYVEGLTNKEISKKYNLLIGKTTRLMYRIKATLNELVHNPNVIRFDYECYQEAIKCPNFPFRGDLEQAKKIFELYVGESSFGRMDIEEIKKILGIDLHSQTITKIIESIVLSTFKYRDGIRKESTFTLNDVLEFYHSNRDNLGEEELQLIENFLNKDFGVDMKMSEDLIYLLLRNKHPDYFRMNISKERAFELFKRYYSQLNKTQKNVFMNYFGVRERDLMSKEEEYLVFTLFTDLESMLKEQQSQK